jgi:membrane protease YdiL (CAAX protease family)
VENSNRRIYIFLAFAFGIAWITGLIIYLTGGIANSPVIIPGTGFTLALTLMASIYMWAPALANIFTRFITREGSQGLMLKPNFKSGWKYWLLGWFGPGILTLFGAAIFFLLLPNSFDASLGTLRSQLSSAGASAFAQNPWNYILIQTMTAILIAPILNFIATFGEEFGWRAYLLPKLQKLGKRTALILTGVIWGVWHWPVIAMGYNFGFNYPAFPWLGLLAMVWFTLGTGIFIGWLTLKSESVWPAVVAHAAINGIAAVGMFAARQPIPTLLGPAPVGIIGGIPFTIVAVAILLNMKD